MKLFSIRLLQVSPSSALGCLGCGAAGCTTDGNPITLSGPASHGPRGAFHWSTREAPITGLQNPRGIWAKQGKTLKQLWSYPDCPKSANTFTLLLQRGRGFSALFKLKNIKMTELWIFTYTFLLRYVLGATFTSKL